VLRGEYVPPFYRKQARNSLIIGASTSTIRACQKADPAIDHVLRRADFFSDGVPLAVLRREPQPPYPFHAHDFSELVLVTRGDATHCLPNFSYRLKPGDVFVINGPQAHGFRDLNDLHLVNILYEPGAMLPPEHARARLARALAMVGDLEEELRARYPGHETAARAHFHLLVTFLARAYSEQTGAAVPHRFMHMAAVISHMEEHYAQSATLEQLAALAACSPSNFARNFRKTTGLSPIAYLLNVRMRHAAKYLAQTDLSVQEIAQRVGIDDSNYFSRQFRAHHKCSPSHYRAQRR